MQTIILYYNNKREDVIMNYPIEHNSHKPAYLQLYEHIVKDIVAGVYPYGTKLPSKRIITLETGVSIITVEHALDLLRDEGYIESRPRSGFYVIYKAADFMSAMPSSQSYLDQVEKENPYTSTEIQTLTPHYKGDFPYSVLAKTIRRVLLDYGDRILTKSPNYGCHELRYEICRYLARSRGIEVTPDQIIIGSGAEYLYGLIAQLLGQDRIYALEDPSYEKIRLVYESFGAKCDLLPLTKHGIPSSALERTEATVLHVTPFNSYPSGISVGISKKREYLQWAIARNGIIIEDNYESELTISKKVEEPLFSMDDEANVIYVNTFSKTISPSMRVGYMILPVELIPPFLKKIGFYSCTVPLLDQFVLTELLKSGDFERHINRVRRERRRQK